jgi:class 3 adenylate cyclase
VDVDRTTGRDAGQAAVRHRRWTEGRELLSAADAEGLLDAAALEALADAAFAVGRHDEALHARERAHQAYLEHGERGLAAAAAVKIANVYVRRGEFSVVGGWMGTAERLLEEEPESVGHGLLCWLHGMFAYVVGQDLEAADRLADETMAIGRRLGDADVQTLGLAIRAEVRAKQGRTDESAPLIDEAMAAALGGALSPWASCHVLCRTMIVCQELGDFRRARQWTSAARETCVREGTTPISGDCRVHHAGLLNWQGEWMEAEQEAETGCREVPDDLMHVGMASYEIGEIRLYRGDLAGAEEAFRRAHEHGRSPHPGLALVRLTQGNTTAALSMVGTALEDETSPLRRAILLAAQVEIALAGGHLELARTGADELAAIELAAPAPSPQALALGARGAVALADGDHATACLKLRAAAKRWTELSVPHRAARARLLLSEAYLGRDDPDSAELELCAAQSTFERLGAQPDAHRASAALRRLRAGAAVPAGGHERVRKAFMFTDIVGSTPLVEALGDDAWTDLLRWHDNTLRAQFTAHFGQEVHHTGDGFFVAFTTPESALRCAECIQRKLATQRRMSGFAPQVRIGVHVDEATSAADDYRGRGVHVAARVGAEAGAGEILVSRDTLDAAGPEFISGESHTVALKGVSQPVELLTVRWD